MNRTLVAFSAIVLASTAAADPAADALALGAQRCKAIHADLVEVAASSGCIAPATSCFLGLVDGNHGLRGVTHFAADSARAGPATSADFISYSGPFTYATARGSLKMRETGVTNPGTGQPQSGAITAYQQVTEGSGEFAGYSGHLFVSGRRTGDVITTRVSGELCRP